MAKRKRVESEDIVCSKLVPGQQLEAYENLETRNNTTEYFCPLKEHGCCTGNLNQQCGYTGSLITIISSANL